ncbi:LysR family transcriptional regulator [Pantoea ananatis]|uniref:LysR family transcriptional regulator n=2 Tax=Pantoea ananas TaxID=553 RepID=UPI0021F7942B|nr:LysR family transcriptional regulator [Pantoea ananatis]MCW0332715.1 hypothetical protein [Pantoea ananatis]
MKFYLKDFCIFNSVAETGSLSKTAELMGLSVSSVSKRITRLEDYLQTALFDKNTRRVNLSPLGRHAYSRSKEITQEFSNFIDEIRESSATPLKVILNTSDIFIPFIDWIYEYANSVSTRGFYINSIQERRKSDEIALDEILISTDRSTYPSAIHRKISPVKRKIYSKNGLITCNDIENFKGKIVCYSVKSNESFHIKKKEKREKIEINPSIKTDNLNVALKLLNETDSIIFGLPEFIMKKKLHEGSVQEVMKEWEIEPIQYYLIWKERSFYKKNFNEFINFIEKKINSFLYT